MMNMRVDEDNGKSLGMMKVRNWKFHWFHSINFGRTLVV